MIKYSIFAPNVLFDFLISSFYLFIAVVIACICSMLISLFFKTISFFIISLSSRKNIFDSFSERMQTIKFKNKRAEKLNKLIDNISKEKRAIIKDLPLDFFNSINLESLNQLSITELKTFKEIFYDFKQINRNHFYKQYQEKDQNNNEKINKVFSQTELAILHKDLSSLNSGSTTTKIEQNNLKNKINIY